METLFFMDCYWTSPFFYPRNSHFWAEKYDGCEDISDFGLDATNSGPNSIDQTFKYEIEQENKESDGNDGNDVGCDNTLQPSANVQNSIADDINLHIKGKYQQENVDCQNNISCLNNATNDITIIQ